MNYVVANFVNLKDHLLKGGFDINLSDCISREIAMIFGNRSLVMLKEGDIGMAIQDAQQSLDYFPTAKVFPYNKYKYSLRPYVHSYDYNSSLVHRSTFIK